MEMKLKNIASLITVVSVVLLVLLSQRAAAGERVDPSTLNPPPPPQFNPVCEKDGNQTICTVQFSDPPFSGGSGVICQAGTTSYEVLQSQNRSVQGKRYYDQNGNLTRKIFREVLTGTFSSPVSHVALSFDGKDTHHEDWTVPGVLINVTGSFHVYLPHGGTVIFEAGRTIETLDNFLSESGPHPFADYFVFGDTAALQPLCDALQ
jgi:hypothetical protein